MRLLVEFAQERLSGANTAKWTRFVRSLSPSFFSVTQGEITEPSLHVMQRAAYELLESIAASKEADLEANIRLNYQRIVDGPLDVAVIALDGRALLVPNGSPIDLFRYVMVQTVQRADVERLRRCEDPTCGRLIWKDGKRRFCSYRCQHRVFMRTERNGGG